MTPSRLDDIRRIYAIMELADPEADATKAMAELIQEVAVELEYREMQAQQQAMQQAMQQGQIFGLGLPQGLAPIPWTFGGQRGQKKPK